jgi:two-component system response regulator MtrA
MKVLVIEDEASIREVEVAFLHEAGYITYEAADGIEGIDAFKTYDPDLLVVDANLPKLNGFEVCKRIRSESNVPIIMVTARRDDTDELAGLAYGADDYIKKPFNPNVLVARVQLLLHRHHGDRLTFGSLTIEPAAMLVTVGGQKVTLTTTQFNLLLALASHPNHVQTRDQLMRQIYRDSSQHDIYDRTIDAHVKSIRSLIEEDPSHPEYIKTVVGSGYVFKEKAGA